MRLFEGWGGGTAVGAGHGPEHRSPDTAAPDPELGDWPAAWGEETKKTQVLQKNHHVVNAYVSI